MRTTSFIYDGNSLPEKLDSFKGEILAQIYVTKEEKNKQSLYKLVRMLQDKFEKPYIVMSYVPLTLQDGVVREGANCIITSFEKTRLNYKLVYDMNNFKKTIYDMIEPDTKAFMIVSDGYIQLENISADLELFKDYHFFGTLGKKPLAFSFSAADNGMVIVSFSGELEINEYTITHYRGLGKYAKVTKANGYRLYEIDHKPAIEYYQRIFSHNKKIDLDFIKNFPLMNRRIGEKLNYVPFKIYDDGSFDMPANFIVGDEVRASYLDTYEVNNRFNNMKEDLKRRNAESCFCYSSCFKYDQYKDLEYIDYIKEVSKNLIPINGALDEIEIGGDNGVPMLACGSCNYVFMSENEHKVDLDMIPHSDNLITRPKEELCMLDGVNSLSKDFDEVTALFQDYFIKEEKVDLRLDEELGIYDETTLIEKIRDHQVDYNVTYVKFLHAEFFRAYYGDTFISNIRKKAIADIKKELKERVEIYKAKEGYIFSSTLNKNDHKDIIDKVIKTNFRYGYTFHGELVDPGLVYSTVFKGNKHPIINAKRGVEEAVRRHLTYFEYNSSNNYFFEVKEGFDKYSLVSKAYRQSLFKVHYQGILNVKTKVIDRYEALIRIVDNGKVYNPSDFLDVAYTYGYSHLITKIVVDEVVTKIRETKKMISINLRISDLEDDELFEYLLRKLNAIDIRSKVVLEVLEDDNLFAHEKCLDRIKCLHEIGIKLAIDDFGTGYSNVNYFSTNCFDYIKIAGELVKNVASNEAVKLMITYIVKTANAFKLDVVAEFCEDLETAKVLEELGVDFIQGFYYSNPDDIDKK